MSNIAALKVVIIESERGWGQKIDEILYFHDIQNAADFVCEHNAKNNKSIVPDIYWLAHDPVPTEVEEGEVTFKDGKS